MGKKQANQAPVYYSYKRIKQVSDIIHQKLEDKNLN